METVRGNVRRMSVDSQQSFPTTSGGSVGSPSVLLANTNAVNAPSAAHHNNASTAIQDLPPSISRAPSIMTYNVVEDADICDDDAYDADHDDDDDDDDIDCGSDDDDSAREEVECAEREASRRHVEATERFDNDEELRLREQEAARRKSRKWSLGNSLRKLARDVFLNLFVYVAVHVFMLCLCLHVAVSFKHEVIPAEHTDLFAKISADVATFNATARRLPLLIDDSEITLFSAHKTMAAWQRDWDALTSSVQAASVQHPVPTWLALLFVVGVSMICGVVGITLYQSLFQTVPMSLGFIPGLVTPRSAQVQSPKQHNSMGPKRHNSDESAVSGVSHSTNNGNGSGNGSGWKAQAWSWTVIYMPWALAVAAGMALSSPTVHIMQSGSDICTAMEAIHDQHFSDVRHWMRHRFGLPGMSVSFTDSTMRCPVLIPVLGVNLGGSWLLTSWMHSEVLFSIPYFGAVWALKNSTRLMVWVYQYITGRIKSKNKLAEIEDLDFTDYLTGSLNVMVGGTLQLRTLFEETLQQRLDPPLYKQCKEAAKRTHAAFPFLRLKNPSYQKIVNTILLNRISSQYSQSYFAADIGLPMKTQKYWFGMTCDIKSRTKKIRTLVASDRLLRYVSRTVVKPERLMVHIQCRHAHDSDEGKAREEEQNGVIRIIVHRDCKGMRAYRKGDDVSFMKGNYVTLTSECPALVHDLKASAFSTDDANVGPTVPPPPPSSRQASNDMGVSVDTPAPASAREEDDGPTPSLPRTSSTNSISSVSAKAKRVSEAAMTALGLARVYSGGSAGSCTHDEPCESTTGIKLAMFRILDVRYVDMHGEELAECKCCALDARAGAERSIFHDDSVRDSKSTLLETPGVGSDEHDAEANHVTDIPNLARFASAQSVDTDGSIAGTLPMGRSRASGHHLHHRSTNSIMLKLRFDREICDSNNVPPKSMEKESSPLPSAMLQLALKWIAALEVGANEHRSAIVLPCLEEPSHLPRWNTLQSMAHLRKTCLTQQTGDATVTSSRPMMSIMSVKIAVPVPPRPAPQIPFATAVPTMGHQQSNGGYMSTSFPLPHHQGGVGGSSSIPLSGKTSASHSPRSHYTVETRSQVDRTEWLRDADYSIFPPNTATTATNANNIAHSSVVPTVAQGISVPGNIDVNNTAGMAHAVQTYGAIQLALARRQYQLLQQQQQPQQQLQSPTLATPETMNDDAPFDEHPDMSMKTPVPTLASPGSAAMMGIDNAAVGAIGGTAPRSRVTFGLATSDKPGEPKSPSRFKHMYSSMGAGNGAGGHVVAAHAGPFGASAQGLDSAGPTPTATEHSTVQERHDGGTVIGATAAPPTESLTSNGVELISRVINGVQKHWDDISPMKK